MGGVYRARDTTLVCRELTKTLTLALAVAVSMVGVAIAQRPAFDRLPADKLNVVPPSARVTGALGTLDIRERSCQSRDLTDEGLRRRDNRYRMARAKSSANFSISLALSGEIISFISTRLSEF